MNFNPNFSSRASQANEAQRPTKGLFRKFGEAIGQVLGLGPAPVDKSSAGKRLDTYGAVPYDRAIPKSMNVVLSGKSRSGERALIPDLHLLSFLETWGTQKPAGPQVARPAPAASRRTV